MYARHPPHHLPTCHHQRQQLALGREAGLTPLCMHLHISWVADACTEAAGLASRRKAGQLSLVMVVADEEASVAAGPNREVTGVVGRGQEGGIYFTKAKQSTEREKRLAFHFALAKEDPRTSGAQIAPQTSRNCWFFWFIVRVVPISARNRQ